MRIGVDVTVGLVHYYLIRLKLAPHETRAIDLRALRDAQVPDFKGHKIPAGATDGSVNWIRLDSVPVEGRLMVIEKQQGMASSYDCTTCQCPAVFQNLGVAPGLFGMLPLNIQPMSSTATYTNCNGGNQFYYDETNASAWDSSNTAAIQMDSSIHYQADGIAAGTSNVNGSYTDCSMYDSNPDFSCPCMSTFTGSGSGAGKVQKPAFVWPSGYSSPISICSGTSCQIDVTYYHVLDSSENPIDVAGMTAQETVTSDPSGTSNVQFADAGQWTTDSTGTFTAPDQVGACCPQGGNGTGKIDQSFSVDGYSVQVLSQDKSTVGSHYVISVACTNGQGSCPVWAPTP